METRMSHEEHGIIEQHQEIFIKKYAVYMHSHLFSYSRVARAFPQDLCVFQLNPHCGL